MKSYNKGFTLMELLIVIGVLGILAAGLLAAIDPFEQLKKARDTNNRSAAIELLQSSQRYYATHGYLPWLKEVSTGVYTCADDGATVTWSRLRPATEATAYPFDAIRIQPDITTGDAVFDCLNETLGEDGEIKDTFFEGLATDLYITSGSTTRVGVCFAPEGKSNRSDASTKYQFSGTTNANYLVNDRTGVTTPSTDVCPDVTKASCLQCFE